MAEAVEAFRDRYGHWGCALFLWGARQLCGLSLREAGEQAGGMHFSTVSTAIRRLGVAPRGGRLAPGATDSACVNWRMTTLTLCGSCSTWLGCVLLLC